MIVDSPLPALMLRAVLDNPDDTDLRLVCSDLLEDHGMADRAQFVRLQVADVGATSLAEKNALADRMAALLTPANFVSWLWPTLSQLPGWEVNVRTPYKIEVWNPSTEATLWLTPRRGFVDEVYSDLHTLLTFLPSLMLFNPVGRVLVSDKRPQGWREDHHIWWKSNSNRATSCLPDFLWDLLPVSPYIQALSPETEKAFHTEVDAASALSDAIIQHCKRLTSP